VAHLPSPKPQFGEVRTHHPADMYGWQLLPTAIQSSMPEIMSLIESRLTQMDNGSLSETERQRVRELMVDLPNSFPRWVENRLTRRGGSTPSRASTQGFS